jgi:hypothetical protein
MNVSGDLLASRAMNDPGAFQIIRQLDPGARDLEQCSLHPDVHGVVRHVDAASGVCAAFLRISHDAYSPKRWLGESSRGLRGYLLHAD